MTVLIIDQRSATTAVSEDRVREWANGRRIFVSSLITDMPDERAAVRAAIESVGAVPVMFEDLGGQDINATQAYLAGVRSSDIYVGAFGNRYGIRMDDGYSATHAEFLEAERQGLRLCLFVLDRDPADMDGPQRDLISGAQNLYTTSSWKTSDELGSRVRQRLVALAGEELAPWVRLGRSVFRAKSITSDGQRVLIGADVRSNAVHAELVSVRESRSGDVTYASPTEALRVQVVSLSTTMTSTTTHEEQLTLEQRSQQQSPQRMSINGHSADELAHKALSDGLFGTHLLGQSTWGIRAVDPIADLRGADLDDVVLRPVARLLIVEHLLSTQSAASLERFELGPAHEGSRRLRLTWTPRRPYVNSPDQDSVTLDGQITGL